MNLQTDHIAEKASKWYWSALLMLLAILLFLFAIDVVGESMTRLGRGTAQSILLATSNPFIGLFIGLLITALIQSSSTVTAMTVAVVASGYLSLANAIPIVMGANVGTTLTSTLVSLGFITKRKEFRKAISAGTVHDFFNIFVVILLFPLEYYYGFLSRLSQQLSQLMRPVTISSGSNSEVQEWSISKLGDAFVDLLPNNFVTIVLALVLLFVSIKILSRIIYTRLIGTSKDKLRRFVFENPFKSFGWGTLVTAGVQSSSITTSLIVPLVASGRVSILNSFPFIMGANIGTTLTALIAAFGKSDAAMSIAMAHLLFNFIGVLIFLPFPFLRIIPARFAYRFGALTLDSRLVGFSYILFTFFLLPFTLIYFSKGTVSNQTLTYEVVENGQKREETIIINTDKVKNQDQYLIYHTDSSGNGENMSIPDTTFVIAAQQSRFASLHSLSGVDSQTGSDKYGDYKQKIVSDTSNYAVSNYTLNRLFLINRSYSNSKGGISRATILVDTVRHIMIKAEYFDAEDRLLKSEGLKSQD